MEELISLDECVVNALKFFSKINLPKIKTKFKNPIVIGSGNAAALGKILFPKAIHANESNYKEILKDSRPDASIIISASAGKHSPLIVKYLKNKKIPTLLLTNNPEGKATSLADETLIFPSISEPYTYNTSTYLGMILSMTKEDPKKILKFLEKIKIPSLKKYNSFLFIVPEKYDFIREFYETKFDELFGPKVWGKAFTFEETKHAKTVVISQKELFIGLGIQNKTFGENRLNYKVPKNASFGLMFCFGYYIIGKIQSQSSPYFKKNISNYVKKISRIFKEEIKVKS